MSVSPQSMREVVQSLRAEGAEAFFEIQALRDSVREILNSLVELDRIAQRLKNDVERVRQSTIGQVPIVLAVHDRVAAISRLTGEILAALVEVDCGICVWDIGDDPTPPEPESSSFN